MVNDFFQDLDSAFKPSSNFSNGKSNTSDTDGFKERFTINDKFDGDGVEASILDGILTVSLPYKAETKPRKVKVKVG
jgi:HSP20 family molecular chaperone IbpA